LQSEGSAQCRGARIEHLAVGGPNTADFLTIDPRMMIKLFCILGFLFTFVIAVVLAMIGSVVAEKENKTKLWLTLCGASYFLGGLAYSIALGLQIF
jgi:hypothetical protein